MSLTETRAQRFLRSLLQMSPRSQIDAVFGEVVEIGGTLKFPHANPTGKYVLGLHGSSVTGSTIEQAISRWIDEASEVCGARP